SKRDWSSDVCSSDLLHTLYVYYNIIIGIYRKYLLFIMIVFIVHPSLRLHEFQYKRCRQNIADQCFNNGEKTSDSDRGDVTVTNGEQCNSTKVYRMHDRSKNIDLPLFAKFD